MVNTLLSTYITSGTTVPSGITVSEIITTTTGITTTYRNALNVSLDGGSTGTITFPGDVEVIGDLYVSGNTYEQDQYITDELIIGTATGYGSWRFIQNGLNLEVQTLSGSTWTTKSTFTGL